MKQLELYGDSILKGVMYAADAGRYRLCGSERWKALEQQGYTVNNHSRMGATIDKGIATLEKRDAFAGDTVAVLEYGGNDCDFDWAAVAADPLGEFLPHTPEEQFMRQYERAILLAREKGATVAMLSLIPIDAEKYFRWISRGQNSGNILNWLGDVSMLARWQEHYSHLVEQLARRMDCPLIDIRQSFLLSRRFSHLLCEDGIHPTREGHELITRRIADAILTMTPTGCAAV